MVAVYFNNGCALMNNKRTVYYDISTRIVKLINLVLMTVPFIFVWYTFYADLLWVKFFGRGHWLVFILFAILYYLIGRVYDAFKLSYNGKGEMVYSQMLSLLEVDAIMYIVAWLLIRHVPNVLPMIAVLGVQIIIAVMWSFLAQSWYFKSFPANKTVVIWDTRQGITELIERYNLQKKYKVIADSSVKECISNIDILNDADTVFMIGVHSHERNIIAKHCLMNSITAMIIPRVGDLIVSSAKRRHMLYLPILKIDRNNLSIEYLALKRAFDIILSLIGIIVSSPIMAATAICIKLEDGGPVFYKQIRLTKDGREFEIIKFRSMITEAESDGVARLSTGDNDDRITKVGKFIRKTRIDEIPNFINILKGDISFVGPRGERPELVKEYEKELPEFALRLQVKAGLTGYAQVYGKYNTSPYDKLLMDLMYIANASIFEDIRILLATVKILFVAESTEGVDDNHTRA